MKKLTEKWMSMTRIYGDNYFDGEYFCGQCENYKTYHKEDKNEK